MRKHSTSLLVSVMTMATCAGIFGQNLTRFDDPQPITVPEGEQVAPIPVVRALTTKD